MHIHAGFTEGIRSAQPPRFPFGLEESEDVTFPYWTFHVPHDETILIIQELDPDLSHLTSGSGTTHHLDDDCKLSLSIHAAERQVTQSDQIRYWWILLFFYETKAT